MRSPVAPNGNYLVQPLFSGALAKSVCKLVGASIASPWAKHALPLLYDKIVAYGTQTVLAFKNRRSVAARRTVVWLSGVRRVGKTTLCQTLADIEYFDCELPRVRRLMDDPQAFLDDVGEGRIVLDEIHRLDNPSELPKIAADHYPSIQILATGSSTLGASTKFRDTPAGRKAELWLTPMIGADLEDFGRQDLHHRFLRGGLPPFFLASELLERDFQEWMDAYWAKDIQELFRLERRHSFQKFAELLMAQSGGIFEGNAICISL